MLGSADGELVEIIGSFTVWRYPGRRQPYTVRRGKSTYYFAETRADVWTWIGKQPKAPVAA